MKKKRIDLLIACILLFALSTGCERRALDCGYDCEDGSFVRINIDWKSINPKPEHLKIVFYPLDNSIPVFRYIDPEGELIQVPEGKYHVLLYNWRTNEDVQSVKFYEEGNYTTFQAYTDFIHLQTFTGEVIAQPDSLYAWSSAGNIVSISDSNKKTYAADGSATYSSDTIAINAQPRSMVKSYDFSIPVVNLEYTRAAEAVLFGATRFKNMYDRTAQGAGYNIQVAVSRNENKDSLKCHFTSFDFTGSEAHIFALNLVLSNNEIVSYSVDLSTDIRQGWIENFTTPIVITPPLENEGGFPDPEIGDWNEESEDIII